MATLSALSAFPSASSALVPQAQTGSVDDLKRWVWTVKTWKATFALSFDDGVLPIYNIGIPDQYIYAGGDYDANTSTYIVDPFANEKYVLDYRHSRIFGASGFSDPDHQWDLIITLGGTIFWESVRSGGGLITSGGDYRYYTLVLLHTISDAASGTLSTDSAYGGTGSLVNALAFDTVTMSLFFSAGVFSGTMSIAPYEYWTYT